MMYAVCVLIGIIVGFALSFLRKRKSADPPMGEIIFDKAIMDGDCPYLGMRRVSDIDVMRSKKIVTLKVVTIDSSSQK